MKLIHYRLHQRIDKRTAQRIADKQSCSSETIHGNYVLTSYSKNRETKGG